MIPTVASIIIKDNKVLLVKHRGTFGHLAGKIGFPSGQITDKTPAQTLIEKLEKETGIKVSEESITLLPYDYSAEIERADGQTKDFSMKTFLVETDSIPNETKENTPIWISISELDYYDLLPNVKKAVLNALDHIEKSSQHRLPAQAGS